MSQGAYSRLHVDPEDLTCPLWVSLLASSITREAFGRQFVGCRTRLIPERDLSQADIDSIVFMIPLFVVELLCIPLVALLWVSHEHPRERRPAVAGVVIDTRSPVH